MLCLSKLCLDFWLKSIVPSPELNLLEGMTLGIDTLDKVPIFKNYLINTGTVHVVVVSGYNIALVASVIKKIVGHKLTILHSFTYILMTYIYVVIVGSTAPVVRAWVMYSLSIVLSLYGRRVLGILSLLFSCIVMYLCDSSVIQSLSFLLSAGSTAGLILFGNLFNEFVRKYIPIHVFILDDLSTSLAASVVVVPIISYKFGRVSLFSPIINMFILWTVPISTILGFVVVIASYIDMTFNSFFSRVFMTMLYPFLHIFTVYIAFLGNISWLTFDYKISRQLFILYYVILSLLYILRLHLKKK